MKMTLAGVIFLAILLSVSFGAEKNAVYGGEIMDSRCAKLGSHDKISKINHTKNAGDCSVACVKSGANYVLFDQIKNVVYQLDNQKQPKYFAGLNVNVTGILDNDAMTIHVKHINTAPGSAAPGW